MAIIRKGVIEPIEFYFSNNNIFLLHASGVVINQKGVVFIGGSKQGKSTLFNYIYNNKLADQYLSDNYIFSDGIDMKAFIEPQRYGKPKFFHHSYYGRNSRHITDIYDYTADLIILLERSDKNTFEKIDKKVATKKIVKIHNTEKEGISFLNKEDPLNKKNNPNLDSSNFLFIIN